MGTSAILPLWLVVALGLLSAAALVQFFLLPGVRWYFRRKVNRVIDEVNTRFNIEIPEFKLTRRRVLIDRLVHDEKVQLAVTRYCESQRLPRNEALARVGVYAREIVPSFNAYAYFRWGYRIAKVYARWLYRVRLGYADSAALLAINPRSSLVFVMNHRSNMDYVCVNFGRPLSMRDYVARVGVDFRALDEDARHRAVAQVGHTLMGAIRDVIPVLPVSLVATVLVRGYSESFAEIDLKTKAYELARKLEASGARVYVPRGDLDYAIGVGLRMLTLRHIVHEREGLFSVVEGEQPLLEYYANAIAPLVDALR